MVHAATTAANTAGMVRLQLRPRVVVPVRLPTISSIMWIMFCETRRDTKRHERDKKRHEVTRRNTKRHTKDKKRQEEAGRDKTRQEETRRNKKKQEETRRDKKRQEET